MNTHQLVVERESRFCCSARSYKVEVDGQLIGSLKNGRHIIANITPGAHTLNFISSTGRVKKSAAVVIDESNQITKVTCWVNNLGEIELQQESGGIHTKPGKAKKKTAGKIIFIFIVVFCLLLLIFGEREDPSNEKQPQSSTGSQTVELTDEEKAAALLDKATAEFESADYVTAIKLCGQITAEYPNTTISENMTAYLNEQYAQFPHYSASELMSEYEANIVNADEQYTDTVMVVTGTVSSIGKTNNDTNLTVVLKSGTYFSGVQLNFKTSQTESVAALSEGDTISAIGKCTGKSGVQFIILDGNNVMIENCYIID